MTQTTFQSVSEKTANRFYNRVVRDNGRLTMANEWRAYAGPRSDWKVQFNRTISGAVGDPDQHVEVATDASVTLPSDTRLGTQKSFHDSEPVQVNRPGYVSLSGSDAAVLAKLLSLGGRVEVHASSGSTSSSRHGLAFYNLSVTLPGLPYGGLTIGGETVTKDGHTIVAGAVSF